MTKELKYHHSPETRAKISAARAGYRAPGVHYSRDNRRLENVWQTMKQRCFNEKRDRFKDYGGRGITVCEEWRYHFEPFAKWSLENGYRDGMQLDRIDNNGDYCPSNCRWVTPKENSRNTRRSKFLTINGETKTVAEWCETLPISQYTVYWWLREYGEKECEKRVLERLSSVA